MSLFKAGVYRTALGAAVTIALILGVVIGCTGSPGETSGAQGPGSGSKSGSNDFPNSLMEVLTKLVTQDIPGQPNLAVKYLLASDALANLDFKTVGKATVQKLKNETISSSPNKVSRTTSASLSARIRLLQSTQSKRRVADTTTRRLKEHGSTTRQSIWAVARSTTGSGKKKQ
jgi:hypothetical protein